MSEEIRLWRIIKGDQLEDIRPAKLNLEQRLETWIEQDISLLHPGLLVIVRQVQTDFGCIIDLLCIDQEGDMAIVELKRDLTSREIIAQALDYASWVRDLTTDRIFEIANQYLGDSGPFEQAFATRFGSEFPEVVNDNHSIFLVASQIDASTERIIKYLSDTYGVRLNAVTFQYFRTPDDQELLARHFLIEPERIESQARSKGASKRRRNLTYDELASLADQHGVGDLYKRLVGELIQRFTRHTTISSIAFTGDFNGSRKAVISLVPPESSKEEGLYFQIYAQHFSQLLGLSEQEVLACLPQNRKNWKYYETAGPDMAGYAGYFRTDTEADRFLERVAARK